MRGLASGRGPRSHEIAARVNTNTSDGCDAAARARTHGVPPRLEITAHLSSMAAPTTARGMQLPRLVRALVVAILVTIISRAEASPRASFVVASALLSWAVVVLEILARGGLP
jgi:hypothetical protein